MHYVYLYHYFTKQLSNMTTTETCPNQADLLAILNNPARVTEKDLKNAHRLMKKWFRFGYAVWLENNA